MIRLLISFVFIFSFTCLFGQVEQDTSVTVEPKVKQKWKPVPKRSALLAIIPGAGQIYNRKLAYIKVPITYAGLIGVGYFATDLNRSYKRFRDALIAEVNGEPHPFILATENDLRRVRDDFNKFRQRAYIGLGAIYLAQILESYVAAHLIDFNLDDDLSFKVKPIFESEYSGSVGMGIALEF